MTDRIEKIVSKWGFKRKEDEFGNPQFEKWYRKFYFCITIFEHEIEVFCLTVNDDLKRFTLSHKISEMEMIRAVDWVREMLLKNPIKNFIDDFFAYDLFHDKKEWKDGKEI